MKKRTTILSFILVVSLLFNIPSLSLAVHALEQKEPVLLQHSEAGTDAPKLPEEHSDTDESQSGDDSYDDSSEQELPEQEPAAEEAAPEETPPEELPTENTEAETALQEKIQRLSQAKTALQDITKENTILALIYLTDEYSIRSQAAYESDPVVTAASGKQVQIQDVEIDNNDEIWYYISLYDQEVLHYGYIPRTYLACSDEKFLIWEDTHEMHSPVSGRRSLARSSSYADIEQFPESYRAALTALKQAHPNWTFVKMNTGLEWDDVVDNQMQDSRSLIESTFPTYMQNGIYSPGWAYASADALKYYLDPRNGIAEETIFQFELLTYNESYHKESSVQAFLNNTFMAGNIPGMGMTYANTFWHVGSQLGVSPFHLASRVYQEQGKGNSPLISGTYPGYEGYYNYFNIGASGNTDQAVYESGLAKAKSEGWNNGYQSIYGGAQILSANYILKGQDTLYLQKFDVDSSYYDLYWHQYMQNIVAPTSESKSILTSYRSAGSLDNTFVFKIPVYDNMPATASPQPTASFEVILTPPAGYSDASIYLDGIGYSAVSRNGSYIINAADASAKTAIMYKYNAANIPVGMYVWNLSYQNGAYTATPVPELEDLLSYHGFSIRITGNSGIRFKTGIAAALRDKLTGSGVSGYKLKEYGTLVMNNANRHQYPLIKDGVKVAGGRSYGRNENNILEDKIYETVSGRYRFTSVLTSLPVAQYKTEFAFRGYMILTKGGQDITLYGPTVWRSIYSLAQQVITSGQYSQGSEADQFLRKLVSDADSQS